MVIMQKTSYYLVSCKGFMDTEIFTNNGKGDIDIYQSAT